jgi:hypothetical protein
MGAFADGHLKGNGMPSGKHYNLNIIGVEKAKTATMTDSNRHTIFVPLRTTGKGIKSVKNQFDSDPEQVADVEIHTQIWLMPSDAFRVCDGNGFDDAYACEDNPFIDVDWNTCAFEQVGDDWVYDCLQLGRKQGAVFELPCNNNLTPAADDPDVDVLEGCDVDSPQSSYEVYARALGKPGDGIKSTMTTCATVFNEDTGNDDLMCSTENVVSTRTKGKSTAAEVTDELTSMVVDLCTEWAVVDGLLTDDCIVWETTRIALFAGDTKDWFWNYQNEGLRLLQLRFYDAN